MSLLEGRSAVITGAAQGIGLAIARVFAGAGARLVVADIDGDAAAKAAAELAADGAEAIAVRCDVTEEADVEAMIAACADAYGRVDVLVNNAGITRDATLRKMTGDQFRQVMDVHLYGTWLGMKHASLRMREQGGGSIVNISSISGKVGLPGQTNYSAAKAGIVGMTKAAAKELAHLNIRVNAIQPGLVRTAMTEALRPDIWAEKLAGVPMGRAAEPEEVGKVALFLAGDLSSYMTGTVLEVTGGRHM
ncbi:3-oxoacyl-[acyl-carrier protein] reductase [Actinocorallia herbida]|uniref:3-oxoacyl-[acyl-carrier protein] reductase n=1 Tax=Actinocorallia herbida TaxID=58109 RepID=A0A3N1CUJ0_9ACTN|nr:3-oxoacyl-ACP reductase FabG [Actinocorallia herbida]ROO84970.1 3-oxoacyl-[acyl-carrier protein] reductase [Actinocorallia herbida]